MWRAFLYLYMGMKYIITIFTILAWVGSSCINISASERINDTEVRTVYTLKSGDKLSFKILNKGYEFNSNITVDADGYISIIYVGDILVNGKSLKEVTNIILDVYKKDYFVNPIINLRILDKSKITFIIMGQVANAGYYEIPQNLNINLLDAIAISGGFSRSAGKVKILSSNDTDPKFIMKIKDVLKLSPNLIPKINHKDKIIIGESFF